MLHTRASAKVCWCVARQIIDTTKYPFSAVGELTGELKGTTRCGSRLGLGVNISTDGCSARCFSIQQLSSMALVMRS